MWEILVFQRNLLVKADKKPQQTKQKRPQKPNKPPPKIYPPFKVLHMEIDGGCIFSFLFCHYITSKFSQVSEVFAVRRRAPD